MLIELVICCSSMVTHSFIVDNLLSNSTEETDFIIHFTPDLSPVVRRTEKVRSVQLQPSITCYKFEFMNVKTLF